MAKGNCSICGKYDVMKRGWCNPHYQNWYRHGDPEISKFIRGDDEARFLFHVDRDGPGGCWIWTGSLLGNGYGQFGDGGKMHKAHRWSYEHFVGPVPADKPELDHLCHTRDRLTCVDASTCPHRRCVNPAHLDPVTRRENLHRSNRIKVSDALAETLYGRWKRGETQVSLAAEAGVSASTLSIRFRRMT